MRRSTVGSVVGGLLLALLVLPGAARPPASPVIGHAATPATTTEALEEVRRAIARILDGVGWPSAEWSILAVSLENGDTLFARDADRPLAPASNVKLVTTAAALHYLGPDFRYTTLALADGEVEGGVLRGDLILYGTGDPGLSGRFYDDRTTALEMIADSLLAAGVRHIQGDVVGDGSYFSGPLLADGWDPLDLNDWFAAPSSALAVNENVVSIRVEPGPRWGTPPEVRTLPEEADLPIVNRAATESGRIHVIRERPTDPISVEGSIPPGGRAVWRQLTVGDPTLYTARIFHSVLEARGIRVDGEVRSVDDPGRSRLTGRRIAAPALGRDAPSVLVQYRSLPLLAYLEVVNKKSHNLLAEMTLKTLGRLVEGEGSYRGGAEVLRRFLADEVGADTTDVRIVDGSGLAEQNRMSAAHFTSLLAYMAGSDHWEAFWRTLPEAGNPRELRRMYRTAAARNLRAKTGTISEVSSLSGVVTTSAGERIAFSILGNDVPSTWRAKRVEDRIGSRLASVDRSWEPRTVRLAAGRTTPVKPREAAPSSAGATARDTNAEDAEVQPERYRVREGDNFTVIARRFGVGLDALRDANPRIPPRELRPGQWLRIPPSTTGS